jgi:hypothetical protein
MDIQFLYSVLQLDYFFKIIYPVVSYYEEINK